MTDPTVYSLLAVGKDGKLAPHEFVLASDWQTEHAARLEAEADLTALHKVVDKLGGRIIQLEAQLDAHQDSKETDHG